MSTPPKIKSTWEAIQIIIGLVIILIIVAGLIYSAANPRPTAPANRGIVVTPTPGPDCYYDKIKGETECTDPPPGANALTQIEPNDYFKPPSNLPKARGNFEAG